jgi:hypothetical protein
MGMTAISDPTAGVKRELNAVGFLRKNVVELFQFSSIIFYSRLDVSSAAWPHPISSNLPNSSDQVFILLKGKFRRPSSFAAKYSNSCTT